MESWGKVALLDLHMCNPVMIRTESALTKFVDELVEFIDMEKYLDPLVKYFGEGNKKGFTVVQLIHTSNVTIHVREENNRVYLDIFSCKDYDEEAVKQFCMQKFSAYDATLTVVLRP